MRPINGVVAGLVLLATCGKNPQDSNPSTLGLGARALVAAPPSELAVWKRLLANAVPDDRYLAAMAFDEARRVIVMFGGMKYSNDGELGPCQETLEWNPKTDIWTNRSSVANRADAGTTGKVPEARSGAGMVFDAEHGTLVLFGGRAANGADLDDTWEWNSETGTWSAVEVAGSRPSARSRHGMVFEKGTSRILLFGGGQSDPSSSDGIDISRSLGDAWEYDTANHAWKALSATGAPAARHDFGMVWDAGHSKAVLFAGMQTDIPGEAGVPKRDTWEWDPVTPAWTERTTAGAKPSARYAHAMAFDGSRGKILVFGGSDINAQGGSLNDLWELNPATGAWTERMVGDVNGSPSPRMWAALLSDDSGGRLELMGGGRRPHALPSREVWELDPVEPAFVDRTDSSLMPSPRYEYAMAYLPSTGKTYLFGGWGLRGGDTPLDDLWQWDGQAWTKISLDVRPPGRSAAAMAYDPIRKSLILFGGSCYSMPGYCNDTWEFGSNAKWTQLAQDQSPPRIAYHAMVTDTARGKILLFGGAASDGGTPTEENKEVWEWDGAAETWTNRTASVCNAMPKVQQLPLLAFNDSRQKMTLLDVGTSELWEWDPISAGWESHALRGLPDVLYVFGVSYDSLRRRLVVGLMQGTSSSYQPATWEIDDAFTVYARTGVPADLPGPTPVFDSKRGVMVAFGNSETWQYAVSNLANGEGCTTGPASACASGFCTEGVCCEVAACPGTCHSCNVPGSEGTCALALPGAKVPGSCAADQACGSNGVCGKSNGQACTVKADCASGICVDGVCCNLSCTGTCASCNQTGREGTCAPFTAGTDPDGECSKGTGLCKSACDGVGACAWPATDVKCADGLTCNGIGDCSFRDPSLGGNSGTIPGSGGMPAGGNGGTNTGGSGGTSGPPDGGRDSARLDGAAVIGGTGGNLSHAGGAAGGVPEAGGTVGGPSSIGGSVSSSAGTAGSSIAGTGGGGGSIVASDGSARMISDSGGGDSARDAGAGDAGRPTTHRSGCSCALGGHNLSPSGLRETPWLLAAALWLLRSRRRR